MTELAASIREFLSTPSARRATTFCAGSPSPHGDFYPRPPRGGRRHDRQLPPHHQEISIHALREEGDTSNRDTLTWVAYFYPRPPRGGRPTAGGLDLLGQGFLSTPSARRATGPHCVVEAAGYYFYPRPPRGGRRAGCPPGSASGNFYPRPPRGGRRFRSP